MRRRRLKLPKLADNFAMSLIAGFFVNLVMSGVQPAFYLLPIFQPAFIIGAAVVFSIPLFIVVAGITFFTTWAAEEIKD